MVDGPTSMPSIVGCQLSGGEDTVQWSRGALGRMEGCQISFARDAGLILAHPSTSPAISGNSFVSASGASVSIPTLVLPGR